VEAIEREWHGWQAHSSWAESPALDTIYFGEVRRRGSIPAAIAQLIQRFVRDRTLSTDAEVTLEANPDDVMPARLGVAGAGVNRISLGAQSFDPACWAGCIAPTMRIRSARRGHAFDSGFRNISLDLIYACPRS
jgi:oxygen-independent coproporphyrinogen-3 oxidase